MTGLLFDVPTLNIRHGQNQLPYKTAQIGFLMKQVIDMFDLHMTSHFPTNIKEKDKYCTTKEFRSIFQIFYENE